MDHTEKIDFKNMLIKGISHRVNNYKSDAYFDLPGNVTMADLYDIRNFVENLTLRSLNVHTDWNVQDEYMFQPTCRLYSKYRLQVWWMYYPSRNPHEFMLGINPILDFNESILFFDNLKNNGKLNDELNGVSNSLSAL
jgi:hypothetical protein